MPNPFSPSSVDHLIAERLPGWLGDASPEHLRGLHRALKAQQASVESMTNLLAALPKLDVLAQHRLQRALLERQGLQVNVRKAQVFTAQQVAMPSAAEKLYQPLVTFRSRQSLLAAALHNYQAEETRPSTLREAYLLDENGRRLALSFEDFARLCRDIDIGACYQAELAKVLRPRSGRGQPEGEARQAVERIFEDSLRTRLDCEAHEAVVRGRLDEAAFQALCPVLGLAEAGSASAAVTARQLYLLGKPVVGVLTLESPAGVIAWIPGDPEASLRTYRSWNDLYDSFARRLRRRSFRTFFARFIKAQDQQAFDSKVAALLANTNSAAAIELDGRNLPLAKNVFAQAATMQIDKLFADARYLAVPTGDLDLLQQHQRVLGMLSAGFDLLGIVGMFIPVLGELVMVISALALADEVYEGYKDWRLGDRQGALDHLFGVAQNLVLAGVMSGVAHVAARVPWVDGLMPVADAAGKLKLARASGLLHHEQSAAELMAGLQGNALTRLLESDAQSLLDITGIGIDQLRRLCVENGRPPARLLDIQERMAACRAYPTLSGSAFDHKLASLREAPSGDQGLLVKAFTGLSARGAQEIIDQSPSAQLETLQATGRVPLGMAERARWYLRDSRLDRACLGIRLAQAVNADTEQLVLGLVDRHMAWPATQRIELRSGGSEGPLLYQTDGAGAAEVRILVRHEQRYAWAGDQAALARGGDTLLESLFNGLDHRQKQAIGQPEPTVRHFRQWLLAAARDDRQQAARLLGLPVVGAGVRPLRRFADGRLGYPMSGRAESSQQAIRRGIHQIFPTLSEMQLDAYIEAVRARGENLWNHLQSLNRQLELLRASLAEWQARWQSPVDAIRRRRVADTLRRSWRRKLVDVNDDYELTIDGERVGSLPGLPPGVDFVHVRRLVLRNMGLEALDPDFLRRFPNILELDLSHNRLTQVPPGIESLIQLRRLNLANNSITIDSAANQRLAQLSLLNSVELSFNPAMRAPDLSGLLHVRNVHLRAAQLVDYQELLRGASWRALIDARHNRIEEIRRELHGLDLRLTRLDLHDNPLDESSQQQVDRLRGGASPGAPGSSQYKHEDADEAVRSRLCEAFDPMLRLRREATWDRLREEPGSSDLFRFIADFSAGEDFEENPGHYRKRIWRILDACEQNEVLREVLFREAAGPRTCEDRLLLTLGQLEIGILVEQGVAGLAPAAAERRLVRLGRQLFRLDMVDGIATRHAARLEAEGHLSVDEIEVRLFYRTRLAVALDLPLHVDEMHYAQFAHVSQRDLRSAELEVIQSETPAVVLESLAHRPFWQRYVRRRYTERFEALATPFHERLAAYEQQAQSHGEQTYIESAHALMKELEEEERKLTLELAREAWERMPS